MNAYPIDNLWRRGEGRYVAVLTGPDPKWGIGRAFLQGKGVKTRGVLEYRPADIGRVPAWVIRSTGECCGSCGQTVKTVELISAMPHGWEVVATGLTTKDLIAVYETGLPGDDPAGQVEQALNPEREPVFASGKVDPF